MVKGLPRTMKAATSRRRRLPPPWLALASVGLAVCLALLLVLAWQGSDVGKTLAPLWARARIAKPNVILITLDTTRADHLGCYGDTNARTPSLDALARRGVLFSQAATVAPLTMPAHSSIMTGLYPTYHGVRVNGTTALGQAQTTLAEVLSQNGYQTGAFIGAFVLDGRWGLNQGFGFYDDHFDMKKFKHLDLAGVQRPGNQVMDSALHWMEDRKDAPFFAWIHLYDAHSPYEPPEPFLSEFGGRGMAALYDGEIAFADQQVGRCVSWLEKAGLDKKTVVVIVGDHGEALGSHGEGTHGYFVYDYALHVPFIVATPFDALRGVRVDSEVSVVDVFPTALALAGIDSAAKVHGRSLLPLMFHPKEPDRVYAYSESMPPNLQFGWSALHSLRSPRYKFIEAPRPELYDLVADPGETTNIVDEQRTVSREMAAALDRLMAETGRDAPQPESANLDKETIDRLAALGYIGATAAPKAAVPSRSLADPKDKLEVFNAVQRAGELIAKDEHAPAAQALEAALREEPSMPQALLMLGSCYTELGRKKEAKAQFDRVLKDDPQSVQGLIGLAGLLLADGQTEEVVTLCKRTLALDDRNTQAYALLGQVYVGRQDPEKALPYLEKAAQIQPKLTQNRLDLAACLIEVKQFDRARASLEEIARDSPKFPMAEFNLGLLYEEQGRPQEARAAYAAEVANYPDAFKARFNLGKVLFGLGDQAGSIAQMREVIRIAPKQPEGYLLLARGLLHESAPLDEVQALVEKGLALAKAPDIKALGWFLMADVWSRRHQPDKVAEALRNAQAQASAGKGGSRHVTGNN
jgi:arylsulfatase A-like enzyme/tetratricopeptide (TPR) repeat protein